MTPSSLRIAALLSAITLAGGALAQTEVPGIAETIDVSIVNLDVVVTDKSGARVRGLKQDDFEIRESGKVRDVTNFSEYAPTRTEGVTSVVGPTSDTPAPIPLPAAAAAPSQRAKRTIVVFIEPFRLPNFRTKVLFDSLREMLHKAVALGDSVSVVSWSNAPMVRQEFTDDLRALFRVVDQLEAESSGVQGNSAADLRRQEAFEAHFLSTAAAAGFSSIRNEKGMDALELARMELFRIRQKVAALNSIMHSIAAQDGRKLVIMATHRMGLYAGAQFFGGTVPFRYQAELATTKWRDALTTTANASNITIYPLFPVGLEWNPNGAEDVRQDIQANDSDADMQNNAYDNLVLFNETAALGEIAEATGGSVAWGSEGIATLLPQVAEDLDSYYSLAYRATAQRNDKARKISVTTRNRDYTVRTRQQSIEKSDDTRMGDRVLAHLFRPTAGAILPIDVQPGKLRKSGRNRWSLPLHIRIPIEALTTNPERGGQAGSFSVYIASGAVFGVISDVQKRTQPFHISAANAAKAKGSHFTYEFVLEVDRVTENVSIGVQDDVSHEYGLLRIPVPVREVVQATR